MTPSITTKQLHCNNNSGLWWASLVGNTLHIVMYQAGRRLTLSRGADARSSLFGPLLGCLCICISSFHFINLCLLPVINVTMTMIAFSEFCLSSELSCVSMGTALVCIKDISLMWQLLFEQKKVCYEESNVVIWIIISLDNADISERRELCHPNNLWSTFIIFIYVISLWDHESISVDWKYTYQFNRKGWVNKQMN